VGTRIVNRIKSTLARLGIRTFKPTLRKAADRLATVHTPEGVPLPPNTLAELQPDMARLGLVVSQIRQIEEARQKRLEQQHETGPHAMVRLLARIVGVGVETADMLVHEVLSRPMRDRRAVARYAGLTGSPDESGARRHEATSCIMIVQNSWNTSRMLTSFWLAMTNTPQPLEQ
jgi:transposase